MGEERNAAIGRRVAQLRKERGLRQAQLADILGVGHAQVVSSIEKGARALKAVELARLSESLHVPPMEILRGEEPKPRPFVLWREVKDPEAKEREEILFLDRCRRYALAERLSGEAPSPDLPAYPLEFPGTTYERARDWAEGVRKTLSLGDLPAPGLMENLENVHGIKIFHCGLQGGSGAATLTEWGSAILLSNEEIHTRRSFSC